MRVPGSESDPRRDLRAAVLLGLFCFLIYNANLRGIGAGDTLPARYLPFGLWRFGTVLLDPIRNDVRESATFPYWVVEGASGHWISLYPVVVPVAVAPLYLPAVAYLHARGWTEWRLQRVAIVMEKLTASLIAAVAVALFYLLLRRRAPPRDATILTLVFALGTNTWMIGSQALWQHGLGELLLIVALLLLTGRCTSVRACAAGAVLALIACNRPPDALLALPLALYGVRWAGRHTPRMIAGAALPALCVVAYNVVAAGNVLGGYGVPARGDYFRFGLLPGVAGMLFSPARGLFVFAPFLLLVPVAAWRGWRDGATRALTAAIVLGAVAQLLFYAKADWRAGYSWGPRWLTDVLPLLVWLLPPAFATLGGARRALFLLAGAVSVLIQGVGAFWYTGASEAAIYAGAPGPEELQGAWRISNAPFLAELRHAAARPDPALLPWTPQVRGFLDRVRTGGPPESPIAPGAPVAVEGWALVGDRAPWAVEATVDGRLRTATSDFIERGDVRASLHVDARAGFRLELDTLGLAPGRHALVLRARLHDSTLTVPFAWKYIVVAESGKPEAFSAPLDGSDALAASARQAAQRIAADQQAAGYWLTLFTRSVRFEEPRVEMNTFLTSMMIDALDPVAGPAGLTTALARARAHLRDQIEADGLVRFHGLPDAPTIGTLGCRITPDADDTALVWRIAPGKAESLPLALSTLARYRAEGGLYRTWLAPPERYECIDRGSDPNPTDIGIQLHVYLFLARADPDAARALCGALPAAFEQDSHWVYYAEAPLVPLLRVDDVRRAGCDVALAPARLASPSPRQQSWLKIAQALAAPAGGAEAIPRGQLLRFLAADDFAWIRATPPLLYHNDLSARVRRFYWSPDFGYALWLRLYLATERSNGAGPEPR